MWPLTGKEIYQTITKTINTKNSFDDIIFEGIFTDSRKIKSKQFFIAIEGERFDGHAFLAECFSKGVQLALVNKNSKYLSNLSQKERNKCIEVDNVLEKFREFAKFMRQRFPFPVIGVAGSNGKTTTKEMLASLLSGGSFKVTKTEKSENGFLGMAVTLCQEAHHKNSPPHALVLEIGIDDIGAMTQHVSLGLPDISIITALGPEHLEHLINWETAVKEELILFQNPNTKRVWQLSDAKIFEAFQNYLKDDNLNRKKLADLKNDYIVIEKNKLKEINHDLKNNVNAIVYWDVIQTSSVESQLNFSVDSKFNNSSTTEEIIFKVPLPGIHNAANFALAFSTAFMLKRTAQQIEIGWKTFVPPPMRSRISNLKNGIVLFDDCYNSSPMSLEAALHAIDSKEWQEKAKLIVLGDMLDLGAESKYWHEKIFYSLKNLQNTYLCLYGSAMYDCYKLLKETENVLLAQNKLRLFWRTADEEPTLFLSDINVKLSDFVILVKGSRGMKLDRLVKSIEENFC
ncbi:UDP-N-acetylmuramoyl-tripeptide--D-alanyl-D-alanine ligase [Silvanigrella aquatica]|uniref:UDP-N-acetylmuramoyl-tripeptide--D-alanyl-D-alanine ligase n=1 Tax=Silvanigrella aquatica TaxID=1915309 RepID=A0A1L4D2D5_9BACT|nr:UDP-N-acetylmuramoyl-tripeptide--D-alanyl-D-alanine ligase [Silvanigrella aquatica]APJ04358.1 hypothetical protein AXG55_10755 [Silvanigrella aquatica]